jgi:tetratricopeptide (TPR) repeat protein
MRGVLKILFFSKAVTGCFIAILAISGCRNNTASNENYQAQKNQVDSLLLKCTEARNTGPQSIISLADSVISIASKINYTEGELGGYYNKAIGYFFQNDFDSSEAWCDKLLSRVNDEPADSLASLRYKGNVFNLKGVIWQKKGEYATAIEHLLKALKHYESIDASKSIATVYTNISENFRFMKDFEKAMDYNIKAEQFLRDENLYGHQLNTVFQNRGNIFNNQGNYEAALLMFKNTLDSARLHKDQDNIDNSLNNLGVSYEEMGKVGQALEYYFRALDNYKSRNNNWGEANTLGNISAIYLQRSEFDKAITFCKNALIIARENGFRELVLYNNRNLARIYETMGLYKQSLDINKSIAGLKDSLYDEEKFRTINSLEQRYREEKAEKLIAQKDKALIQAQLNSKTLLIFLIIFGVIILVSLIIGFFLYKQVQLRKQKNLELQRKNAIIEAKNKEITEQRDEIKNQKEDLELLLTAYETHGAKEIRFGKRKIPLEDIIYIKYHNRISHIFLKDGRIMEHRVQLSQLSSELKYRSNFLFAQINQNYIVNFDNVDIYFFDGEDEKFYYTNFLDNDFEEGRTEEFVKTRKRSGLTKNFERDYKRYQRLRAFNVTN